MSRETTASESIVINASPDEIYERVSDPANIGRWSPENTGATVDRGGEQAAFVGMEFWGHNRRGLMRWTTKCIVTAAEPGKVFAFRVAGQRMGGKDKVRLPFDIATWEYRFEPVDGGTRVTETWTDDRHSTAFGRISRTSDRLVTGGATFANLHRKNMRRTLEALKQEIESARRGSDAL